MIGTLVGMNATRLEKPSPDLLSPAAQVSYVLKDVSEDRSLPDNLRASLLRGSMATGRALSNVRAGLSGSPSGCLRSSNATPPRRSAQIAFLARLCEPRSRILIRVAKLAAGAARQGNWASLRTPIEVRTTSSTNRGLRRCLRSRRSLARVAVVIGLPTVEEAREYDDTIGVDVVPVPRRE